MDSMHYIAVVMKNFLNVVRCLPDGRCYEVHPFHVCTKGYEDKTILRDECDYGMAQNLLAACSRRAEVLPVAYCLLNTHFHAVVLAQDRSRAKRFADSFKLSVARCLSAKYPDYSGRLVEVEVSAIPIDSPRYLRDCISYVLCNALDMGVAIDSYKWSSFRAYFCNGTVPPECFPVSGLKYREIRKLFHVAGNETSGKWFINKSGVVEPASFCECGFVEELYFNDQQFFFKSLGMSNKCAMNQILVENPRRRWTIEELLREIESASRRMFSCGPAGLTTAQKYILLKSVYYSTMASRAQLSRCLGLNLETVDKVLR